MNVHYSIPTVGFRKLHTRQKEIQRGLGQRNVLRCGRRFGKTELLESIFSMRALRGRKVGWFTPDYKLSRPTYARIHKALQPIIAHSSKTDALIELTSRGSIEFWTLDNEDAGRSRSYDDVVIDEASLKKTGLRDIVEQAIAPTLLDRRGTLTMAGTPKGIDPDNFFYMACTDPELKWAEDSPEDEAGIRWKEFYAPTRDNPTLDQIGVAALEKSYPALVYQQEYLAEFVDWSGSAFFSINSLMEDDGSFAPYPSRCDTIFCIIDTATKTGREHDGTAVTWFAFLRFPEPRLFILDWDIVQVEGSLLVSWLPLIFTRCNELAAMCGARNGSIGAFIEDKASGMILLQQALRQDMPARAIDSKLTSLGKDERAINVSGYVHRREVKLTGFANDKIVNYKGQSANHFRKQVVGYRVGQKDEDDDILDTFTYGVALSLGNGEGF